MKDKTIFKNKFLGFALLFPQLILVIIFFLIPIYQSFLMSFTKTDPFGINSKFVFLENYLNFLFDKNYLNSVKVTIIISFLIISISLPLSLFLAYNSQKPIYGKRIFKTLLIFPFSIAPTIASVIWVFIFQPTIGIISRILGNLGYNWNYILNENQALFLVVLVSSWKQFGYNYIFYLSALTSIPNSIIEAAKIDGASSTKIFWEIIFPFISPTTFYLIVMSFNFSLFDTFGIIDTLTKGGPAKATENLIYKAYLDGIVKYDINSSAAQSVILLLLGTFATFLQFKFLEKKVYYHGK